MRGPVTTQLAIREDPSRARVGVGEAHTSREASNDRGAKGPSVQGSGPKEQERERLVRSLATSIKRSAVPEGLRCLSEPGHTLRVFWVGDRISPLVRKPDAGKSACPV